MFTGPKKITEENFDKVLKSLDLGVPTNILCKKYGVSHAYMVALKISRKLPDLTDGNQLSKVGNNWVHATRWSQARTNQDIQAIHGQVRRAIGRGELIKPIECSSCLRVKPLDGHHDDYSKPLEVRWLCRRCHLAHHAMTPDGHNNGGG